MTLGVILLCAGCESPGEQLSSSALSEHLGEPVRLAQPTAYPVDDLFWVRDAVRSGDEVLVFETRDPRLLRLKEDGLIEERLLLGDGPGEYREITSVSAGPGDSLIVFDAGIRRVSVLTSTGEFVRSVHLSGSDRPILGQLRWSDGGWIVAAGSQVTPGQHVGPWRPMHEILRFAPDGSFRGVIRSFPGPEVFFGETGGFVLPVVARRSSWDVLDAVLVLSDGMTVTLTDLTNGFEKELALGLGGRSPLLESEHQSLLDSLAIGMSAAQRRRLSSTYRITSLPSELPAVGEVVSSTDGVVWVSEYADPRAENRRWLRFDVAKGELRGRFLLPTRVDLLHADGETLLGLVTDSLGVERIVRYAVPGEAQ